MSKVQSDLPETALARARQGDGEAIAAILHQALNPAVNTTRTVLRDTCLYVRLEDAVAPDQDTTIAALKQAIATLALPTIQRVQVYGWVMGDEFPSWQTEFVPKPASSWFSDIRHRIPTLPHPLKWNAKTESAPPRDSAQSLPETVMEDGTADGITDETTNETTDETTDLAIAPRTASWWSTMGNAVSTMMESVGSTASQSGQAINTAMTSAVATANALGEQTGKALSQTAQGAIQTVGDATDGLGQVVDKVDWLLPFLEKVDVTKAEASVQRLKARYPDESARAIAHRIMVQKALYVTGTGAASSFVPGLVVLDLASTTALLAEMGYQIAGAYGMDLHNPARKGELLAIFGLAMGGTYAMHAGLGLMRSIPLAGAVVGASTNAVALYTVGHAACQFYESQNQNASEQSLIEATEDERDTYLQGAIAQQLCMDQILAHMVKASQPQITWEQARPELERLNFSPTSLNVIESTLDALPPLETLLAQLNAEFAVPLLAQCRAIATADNHITEAEANILNQLEESFAIALPDST